MPGGFTYTHATLLTGLQAYFDDDSAEYVAELPFIINRAEIRAVRDLDLTVFNSRTEGSFTGSSATQTMPETALMVDSIWMVVDRKFLQRRSVDWLTAFDNGTEQLPKFFGQDANEADDTLVRVSPVPDQAYAVVWWTYDRPDALTTSTNETNWLTENVSDLLWAACLVESAKYLGMGQQLQTEEAGYQILMSSAKVEYKHLSRRDNKNLEAAPRVAKA